VSSESRRDLEAWLAINDTKGIGPKSAARIARFLKERGLAAGQLRERDEGDLLRLFGSAGAREVTARRLIASLADTQAPPSLEGVEILHPNHEAYPSQLDPERPLPPILYARGSVHLLSQCSVAIVGSRDAQEKDVAFVAALAHRLGEAGLNVVSGHARGVDHAAHRGALASGGTTTAVLAEGIARFKPRSGLAGDPHSLLVISEFPPDARWHAHQAMTRNATVAGLSRAVVVARSGPQGGTREMIRLCRRTGLPVLAPRGAIDPEAREGVVELDADVDAFATAICESVREIASGEPQELRLFD
jgi:DNA processing protein